MMWKRALLLLATAVACGEGDNGNDTETNACPGFAACTTSGDHGESTALSSDSGSSTASMETSGSPGSTGSESESGGDSKPPTFDVCSARTPECPPGMTCMLSQCAECEGQGVCVPADAEECWQGRMAGVLCTNGRCLRPGCSPEGSYGVCLDFDESDEICNAQAGCWEGCSPF